MPSPQEFLKKVIVADFLLAPVAFGLHRVKSKLRFHEADITAAVASVSKFGQACWGQLKCCAVYCAALVIFILQSSIRLRMSVAAKVKRRASGPFSIVSLAAYVLGVFAPLLVAFC